MQACLAGWLRFLEAEQGQGASWLDKAHRVGESFLTLIEDEDGVLHWERVDVGMVNEFLVRAVAGYSSSTAQCTAALLRGLPAWAAVNGWARERVADGVLSPRRIRTGLPKGLTAGEVAALKDAVNPDSVTGKRDLAIIVMLARLGVRVGEVAGLKLEDLNWHEPSLRVVGKGGRVLVLPMPVDVGEALVGYLRVRRADPAERVVFVRSMPPLLMLVCDGLKGLPEAVNTVWEHTTVQTCVIHLLRNTFKYAARQNWDQIARDIKPVYTAATEVHPEPWRVPYAASRSRAVAS